MYVNTLQDPSWTSIVNSVSIEDSERKLKELLNKTEKEGKKRGLTISHKIKKGEWMILAKLTVKIMS